MDITPSALPHREVYKLLIGAIVPRPIAWVSTVDEGGTPNLAPFSFFTAVCSDPPTVIFCPGIRDTDKTPKTHSTTFAPPANTSSTSSPNRWPAR